MQARAVSALCRRVLEENIVCMQRPILLITFFPVRPFGQGLFFNALSRENLREMDPWPGVWLNMLRLFLMCPVLHMSSITDISVKFVKCA